MQVVVIFPETVLQNCTASHTRRQYFLFVIDDRKYIQNINNSTFQCKLIKLKKHRLTIMGPHFDVPLNIGITVL
jgi:hypothetical protein